MKKILITGILIFMSMNIQSAEHQLVTWNVTQDESASFCKHLNGAVNGCRKAISEGILSDNNSIYVILQGLQNKLNKNNNDVEEFIKQESLHSFLWPYQNIDHKRHNEFLLKQVKNGLGDAEKAKNLLIENRKINASLLLASQQPTFSPAAVGEPATPKVMNFIQRNSNYGINADGELDRTAMNDYIVNFIYKVIVAQRITADSQ